MSKVDFIITAEPRTDLGKGASRRLRRTNMVPGVIYGGDSAPVSISVDHNELYHDLENEAFYSHILTLKLGESTQKVVLKDLQRHPAKDLIMHVDFQRASADSVLHMNVPLHFVNEAVAPGVKAGGIVTHTMTEVAVTCLASNLPEFIEVDLSALELDHPLHLTDLKLPEGVSLVELSHGEDHNLPVVSIHLPRGAGASDEASAE